MKQPITFLLFCFIFQFSFAQNPVWTRQSPAGTIKEMLDVAFNDQGYGIAVGVKAPILRTSDWGNNWVETSNPAPYQSLSNVAFSPLPNSQVAYIMTNNTILKTTNAGSSWTDLNLITVAFAGIPNMSVLSDTEVFASGSNAILHTSDGGVNWTETNKPSSGGALNSVHFITPEMGWVGTQNGHIYRTTDGGNSWLALDTLQFTEQVRLRFLDANTGVACINRKLARTSNGGATWTVIQETAFGSHADDIAFIDADNIIFSQGDATFYTHDGGQTTTEKRPALYANKNRGIHVKPDGRVWVASSYGAVFFSSDSGEAYVDQIPGNKYPLQVVDFTDANHGWIAGFNFSILKTADGGNNWEDISPALTEDWRTIRGGLAFSEDEFWACGQSFLVKTTDGGASWTAIYDGIPTGVEQMARTSNAVFACALDGKVYKTTDGGTTWNGTTVLAGNWLQRISFPTNNTGFVGGQQGLIAKTTDGGATWSTISSPTPYNIAEVFFLDENRGWICTDQYGKIIYYTTDGGATWLEGNSDVSAFWRQIRFEDEMHGWLTGGSSGFGRVAVTNDGGVTWEAVYVAEELLNALDIISTPESLLIWVCGGGGIVEQGVVALTSTAEKQQTSALQVYPNPVNDVITFSSTVSFTTEALVEIIDLDGKVLWARKGVPGKIQMSPFAPGFYCLRVSDGNAVYTGKILVQR